METLYPLLFEPVYKEKIWGGRNMAELYGRELPPGQIGESWDIASHPHGMSIAANGELRGMSLEDLYAQYGSRLVGAAETHGQLGRFPLLVKIIDANDWLSVQVHPDDAYAALHENGESGKTEMWYVLCAEPGATIVHGLKPGVTKDGFARAVNEKAVMDCLNTVPVQAGDVFEIPAGAVHALGQGVMVAEVQQNSDMVYRLYDWDRLENGQPRELHVDKAMDVIDFDFVSRRYGQGEELVSNAYFTVRRLEVDGDKGYPLHDTFHILMNLEHPVQVKGSGVTVSLRPGQSCLVPAECQNYRIDGKSTLLQAQLPR